MKEEAAKQKRCAGPNGCGTLINPISGGRVPGEMLLQLAIEVNSPRWCIASDCMGWRETGEIKQDTGETEGFVDGGVNLVRPIVVTVETGYCGLAGKP